MAHPFAPASTSENGPSGYPWFDGNFQYHQYDRLCFPEGWISAFVISYVGYEQAQDGSFPKVGDTYYAHFVAGLVPRSASASGGPPPSRNAPPDNRQSPRGPGPPRHGFFTSRCPRAWCRRDHEA